MTTKASKSAPFREGGDSAQAAPDPQDAPEDLPQPRRVGRPPKIDRDSIARAVIEIGFDQVTTRLVAEHLGVSAAGLYYYVRGRDDLLLLASEYSIASQARPEDLGQHWADWLREWARYTRSTMDEYRLIEHYICGLINIEFMLKIAASNLDVLARRGFDPETALSVWGSVVNLAIGSAVESVRASAVTRAASDGESGEQRDGRRGAPTVDRQMLRETAALETDAERDAGFEERLTILLIGLAVRYGRPVDDHVLGIAVSADEPV